ncbi:DNA methyltransferase [Vibrio phage K225]|nr:modification methylase [Vibrio phage 69E27.1]
MKAKINNSNHSDNNNNEWRTPPRIIERARRVMGSIDTDPASSEDANKRIKAGTYYDERSDGLMQEWFGNVWMNPPYSTALIGRFCSKLEEEFKSKNTKQAVVITNNGTETKYAQSLSSICSAICLVDGRLAFELDGEVQDNNNKGSIVWYVGDSPEGFADEFQEIGRIFFCRNRDIWS